MASPDLQSDRNIIPNSPKSYRHIVTKTNLATADMELLADRECQEVDPRVDLVDLQTAATATKNQKMIHFKMLDSTRMHKHDLSKLINSISHGRNRPRGASSSPSRRSRWASQPSTTAPKRSSLSGATSSTRT